MMKRVLVLAFMLSCVLALAGCSNSDTETTNRTDISSNSVSVSGDISVFADTEESLLDAASKDAVFIENFGDYLPGECQGIGYKIIETFEENGVLSVYALTL